MGQYSSSYLVSSDFLQADVSVEVSLPSKCCLVVRHQVQVSLLLGLQSLPRRSMQAKYQEWQFLLPLFFAIMSDKTWLSIFNVHVRGRCCMSEREIIARVLIVKNQFTSFYTFHLGQENATVLGQVGHSGQIGNAIRTIMQGETSETDHTQIRHFCYSAIYRTKKL